MCAIHGKTRTWLGDENLITCSSLKMDSFLDFDYPNPIHPSSGTDSVVPVKVKPNPPSPVFNNSENCFDIEFCISKLSTFNYFARCLSHSVLSSSLDVGVVLDGNSMSEISYSFGRAVSQSNGSPSDPLPSVSALGTNSAQATQLCGLDREAKVLRYKEKRKNHKFEKMIRYASRKAYAETRPRIKGQFAKRTEIDNDSSKMKIVPYWNTCLLNGPSIFNVTLTP